MAATSRADIPSNGWEAWAVCPKTQILGIKALERDPTPFSFPG